MRFILDYLIQVFFLLDIEIKNFNSIISTEKIKELDVKVVKLLYQKNLENRHFL